MAPAKGCCGMHVKTSAKVLSLVGIILSFASLLSCIAVWIYTPISAAFLLSFIFVIIGVKRNRPTFLFAANFVLAINTFVNILLFIGSIITGIIVPQSLINNYNTFKSENNDFSDAKKEIKITCFVLAFILFIAINGTLFAIYIIHKARKFIIQYLQRPFSTPSSAAAVAGYPLAFIRLPPPYSETVTPPPPMYSNDDYNFNSPPSYFNEYNNIAPPAYSDTSSEENKQPKSFLRRKLFLICYSCDG